MADAEDLPIWGDLVVQACLPLKPAQIVIVQEFAVRLASLSDDELERECCRWIYNSEMMRGSRRPVVDHAMFELCSNEARRRDPAMALFARARSLVLDP